MLTGERAGRFVAVRPPGGQRVNVNADLSKIFEVNEAGLMGLALDPRFSDNRRVYSCQAEYTVPGAFAVPEPLAGAPIPAPQTGPDHEGGLLARQRGLDADASGTDPAQRYPGQLLGQSCRLWPGRDRRQYLGRYR